VPTTCSAPRSFDSIAKIPGVGADVQHAQPVEPFRERLHPCAGVGNRLGLMRFVFRPVPFHRDLIEVKELDRHSWRE